MHRGLVFLLLVACLGELFPCIRAGENSEDDKIKIEAEVYKITYGDSAEFKCTSEEYTNNTLRWLSPSGTEIADLNDTRFSDENGVLKILDVTESDEGVYTCVYIVNRTHNATQELIAYDMPTYFKAGMTILAINIALIVLFLACCVVSTVKNRKEVKKYSSYKQASVKDQRKGEGPAESVDVV